MFRFVSKLLLDPYFLIYKTKCELFGKVYMIQKRIALETGYTKHGLPTVQIEISFEKGGTPQKVTGVSETLVSCKTNSYS